MQQDNYSNENNRGSSINSGSDPNISSSGIRRITHQLANVSILDIFLHYTIQYIYLDYWTWM